MTAPTARVGRVADYLCDGVAALPGDDLAEEIGAWLAESGRFLAFAEANRDKIRKKLRTANEPGTRGDVRAELETAFRLLADRRFDLAFEAYGSGNRGPDFTITFRASHKFNLEVTRPRVRDNDAGAGAAFGGPLLGKLRQLPADAPNAILLAGPLAASVAEVEANVRVLKLQADRGDERFFAARGLTAKEFQTLHRRMAMLMVGNAVGNGVHAWLNPEARRRLPDGAANACVTALAAARWRD